MKNFRILSFLIIILVAIGCKKDDDNPPVFTMNFNGQQLQWDNTKLTPSVVHHQSTINGTEYYQTAYDVVLEDLTSHKSLRVYFGFSVTSDSIQIPNADRFYNYFGTGANNYNYSDEEATANTTYQVAVRYYDGTDFWFNVSAPVSANNYFNITHTSHVVEVCVPIVYFTSNFKCQIKIPNTLTVAEIVVPEYNGKVALIN